VGVVRDGLWKCVEAGFEIFFVIPAMRRLDEKLTEKITKE